MKFILLENLLNEDLDEVYTRYYAQNFDRETFDTLIAADPTFKPETNKLGSYGKWILQIAKKDSSITGVLDEVKEALASFNSVKNKLPPQYKDIMRIKSFAELKEVINTVGRDLETKSDFRHKAENAVDAETGKKIDGIEFITKINKWEIYSPKTYEASKWLRGQNASWCTGRHEDDSYYKSYTDGTNQLFIFVDSTRAFEDKPDTPDVFNEPKYQLAVYGPTGTFRDWRSASNPLEWGDTYEKFVSFVMHYKLLKGLTEDPVLGKLAVVKDLAAVADLAEGKVYNYTRAFTKENPSILIKKAIKKLKVADGITQLPTAEFYNLDSLEELEIPASVTKIGNNLCQNCTNLKVVKFADGCTAELPTNCFKNCKSLQDVYMPVTMQKVMAYAFGQHTGTTENDNCPNVVIHKVKDMRPAETRQYSFIVKASDADWIRNHVEFIEY